MLFNNLFVHMVNSMWLIIYYILEYYIGLKVFVGGSILRFKTVGSLEYIQELLYLWIVKILIQLLCKMK